MEQIQENKNYVLDLKDRLNEVIKGLNEEEAKRLKEEGFINECFFKPDGTLTDNYKVTLKEKKKYFYIDFGTSGAFMVSKEDFNIFNIKGYGTPNLNKCYASVFLINIELLHKLRWDYRR